MKQSKSTLMVQCSAAMMLWLCTSPLAAQPKVTGEVQFKLGIEVLIESKQHLIAGKRLGLITNLTGTNAAGVSNVQLLKQAKQNLRVIFSPEHGFMASEEAGKKINGADSLSDVPVISLYGKTLRPTKTNLDSLETIIFDIQDVGTRCYTYISTMKLAMQACAEQGKIFIVLDRPNPISPLPADGFTLSEKFSSFVGIIPVPHLHRMTIGELALMIHAEELPTLNLTVVPMQNYNRDKFGDEQSNLSPRFIPPSPNIKSPDAEILYPATVFLEGTPVSEGRGTESPFEQFGSPFIVAAQIADELNKYGLAGVRFESVSFVPESIAGKSLSPKFEGRKCEGVRIHITDRNKIQPFAIGVAVLVTLKKLYPKEFVWLKGNFIDKLAGTDELRRQVDDGKTFNEILKSGRAGLERFEQRRIKYLLY
ncbi:MAG: DUF1343 domain-containing protein [Rhizobacter sp.]|nr:DUF1343 domain-containing protein [Chlorobiales bacterium]